MLLFGSRRLLVLLLGLIAVFLGDVASEAARETIQIAGRAALRRDDHSRICVDKAEGHYLCLYSFEGHNWSTGKSSFMNEATMTHWIFADAVKRNGPIQGYTTMSNQGGSVLLKLRGHWTTIESADGSPLSQFEGTFLIEKGTGQFANIEGTGTFTGKMTTPFVQVVEWEGEYSIRK